MKKARIAGKANIAFYGNTAYLSAALSLVRTELFTNMYTVYKQCKYLFDDMLTHIYM